MESTLSTFVALDGENIAVQDWPLPDDGVLRGVVLIVHGLGEHAGRYDALAQQLNLWGFAVRGYDQFGHGESGGARGGLPYDQRLIDDLTDMVDSARVRMPSDVPLILLGHSMGGLVAAKFVDMALRKVDALVLSSPALDAGLTPVQKALLSVLPRFVPNLRVGNGLNPNYLSHDPAVARAYQDDKLVHDRISGRLGRFIAESGPQVLARAATWRVPTLLLYAGADRLVNPQGSRDFARDAPADVVQSHCFDTLYHEIFNEPERNEVLAHLQRWLDKRF